MLVLFGEVIHYIGNGGAAFGLLDFDFNDGYLPAAAILNTDVSNLVPEVEFRFDLHICFWLSQMNRAMLISMNKM